MTFPPLTPWQAIARPPLRFLASSWPWRSLAYLVTGAALAGMCAGAATVLALSGLVLTLALVGVVLLLVLLLMGMPVAALERRRARLVLAEPIAGAHRPPTEAGLAAWLRLRLREWATWRELAYTLAFAFVLGPIEFLVTAGFVAICGTLPVAAWHTLGNPSDRVSLGPVHVAGAAGAALCLAIAVVVAVIGAYVVTAVAGAQVTVARVLLGSREEELDAQVTEVTRSRARLVDAFEAERRRIERDLHDGAQQRLVALTLKLGIARMTLGDGHGEAATLVSGAQDDAKAALAELRELVHGIHPQILTDRGLPPALADLAGRSPVPAMTDVRLPARLPPVVENAAYFVVSEALANAAKHARAGRVEVSARVTGGTLVVTVRDDGVGGADPGRGSGLQGLADRVAVVAGTLDVTSPPGGPTIVRAAIPVG